MNFSKTIPVFHVPLTDKATALKETSLKQQFLSFSMILPIHSKHYCLALQDSFKAIYEIWLKATFS